MSETEIQTSPIDDAARDGSLRLVIAEGHFNLVRWCEETGAFVFSNGARLPGEPGSYVTRFGGIGT